MKKQIAFPIIGVLAAALIAVTVVFILNINAANAEIDTHKNTIAGLETDLGTSRAEATDLSAKLTASESEVATLEGNVTDLEGDVADLEARNTQLDSDLQAANSQITSLQTTNESLTAELKTVKDPRHFSSVSELTDWLQQDNTDTQYAPLFSTTHFVARDYILMSFILEVRATRDGFILPTYILPSSSGTWISNYAIIGDKMYLVEAGDDSVTLLATFNTIQPSHPEPLP